MGYSIYIAAGYGRRQELLAPARFFGSCVLVGGLAERLQLAGHTITSHWITETRDRVDGDHNEYLCASMDLYDVRRSDLLVYLSGKLPRSRGRGGKHVELGYALGLGIPVVVLGDPENIFHSLVPAVQSVDELIQELKDKGLPPKFVPFVPKLMTEERG